MHFISLIEIYAKTHCQYGISIELAIHLCELGLYTVGHKKGATFIFTITLANVDRFQ